MNSLNSKAAVRVQLSLQASLRAPTGMNSLTFLPGFSSATFSTSSSIRTRLLSRGSQPLKVLQNNGFTHHGRDSCVKPRPGGWRRPFSRASHLRGQNDEKSGNDGEMARKKQDDLEVAKEKQVRKPWHREGTDQPPVARPRSAGAMTKGSPF